ncbi:MAG: hypothetical protein WCP79_14515 [Bacillota bacterium]
MIKAVNVDCGKCELKQHCIALSEQIRQAQKLEQFQKQAANCLERHAARLALFVEREGLTDKYNLYALKQTK